MLWCYVNCYNAYNNNSHTLPVPSSRPLNHIVNNTHVLSKHYATFWIGQHCKVPWIHMISCNNEWIEITNPRKRIAQVLWLLLMFLDTITNIFDQHAYQPWVAIGSCMAIHYHPVEEHALEDQRCKEKHTAIFNAHSVITWRASLHRIFKAWKFG